MESNDELCARIECLQRKVTELSDSVFFLESEILAIGNILINSKQIDKNSLAKMTEFIVKQKVKEREEERNSSPIHMTKEELQAAIQGKIKQ